MTTLEVETASLRDFAATGQPRTGGALDAARNAVGGAVVSPGAYPFGAGDLVEAIRGGLDQALAAVTDLDAATQGLYEAVLATAQAYDAAEDDNSARARTISEV